MKIIKNQKGDTIVEVLLAVAALSLVLTASYVLANRSSQGIRQAQERSEALKHTETQLEWLKNYLAQPGAVSWNNGTDICMRDANTKATSASQCGFGTNNRYGVVITKPIATDTLYRARTNWENIKGRPDTFTLSYKLTDPSSTTGGGGIPGFPGIPGGGLGGGGGGLLGGGGSGGGCGLLGC